mmetsp:Transcript_35028/g.63011  ORF Transcript_35028/g.63011 Transcript_35028/m.63011 type:complete len:202 (-) Transcript_35028:46-651(-)
MTSETIISKDAAKIRMIREKNTEHVPSLTLKPVGSVPDARNAGDGSDFINNNLNADTIVKSRGQKMVNNLKASRALGVINSSDVDKSLVLKVNVIAKEGTESIDMLRSGVNSGLLIENATLSRTIHCHSDILRNSLDNVVREVIVTEVLNVVISNVVLVSHLASIAIGHIADSLHLSAIGTRSSVHNTAQESLGIPEHIYY